MSNEAKIIINSLNGCRKADIKSTVVNQVVTYAGIALGYRVPLLKGVPVALYSALVQNPDDEMLNVEQAQLHVEMHNPNDMEMLMTYGKSIDVDVIDGLITDLIQWLSKEECHA